MAYEPLRPEAPVPAPQPEYYPPSYTPEPAHSRPPLKRAGGVLAALGILAVKFGAKLKALLLLLPKLKIFTTSASMLVSIAAYSLIWGWKFALGFVILLLVHEMGHVVQLRREGVPASAPLFIPFLGAVVGMKQMPKDAAAEARVGLAGPVLGSLGCVVPLAIYWLTGDVFWQALAFTGFFLNLINLLPVLPLDGGRAAAALSPWMWLVGFALMLGLAVVFPNPIILLVVIVGGFETYRRWKLRKTPAAQDYYRVKPWTRAAIALVYVGLAAALVVGMDLTFVEREISDA